MTNLTYERVNILGFISDEDVKVMQKLKKIKKSAEEDYEFLCKSITFKFSQEEVKYKVIADEKYCAAQFFCCGEILLEKHDGHYDRFSIESKDDIYKYYKAQYLLSKKILPDDEDEKEKFVDYAYFGTEIRKLIHKISYGQFILVE